MEYVISDHHHVYQPSSTDVSLLTNATRLKVTWPLSALVCPKTAMTSQRTLNTSDEFFLLLQRASVYYNAFQSTSKFQTAILELFFNHSFALSAPSLMLSWGISSAKRLTCVYAANDGIRSFGPSGPIDVSEVSSNKRHAHHLHTPTPK